MEENRTASEGRSKSANAGPPRSYLKHHVPKRQLGAIRVCYDTLSSTYSFHLIHVKIYFLQDSTETTEL